MHYDPMMDPTLFLISGFFYMILGAIGNFVLIVIAAAIFGSITYTYKAIKNTFFPDPEIDPQIEKDRLFRKNTEEHNKRVVTALVAATREREHAAASPRACSTLP
jgi:branched-subunit amino acid ABC-type transport system permease component